MPSPRALVDMLNRDVGKQTIEGVDFTYVLQFTKIEAHGGIRVQWTSVCDFQGRRLVGDGAQAYFLRSQRALKPMGLTIEAGYLSEIPLSDRQANTITLQLPLWIVPLREKSPPLKAKRLGD